ncbi:MAG: hypothetical protein QF454_02540 [Candidatus Thalassarchaeaceae archaeon]|jgi:hypothetical protein|nr:hypothetical protein [Candidatus Thalassarchaeaceae archaeon]
MSEGGVSRPLAPLDTERLEKEMDNYQSILDTQCDAIYQIATEARAKGFDLSDEVEIPRAIDLADRAEKLLAPWLEGIPIAKDIRDMLAEKDRENASIDMAVHVAVQMHDRTADVQKSIDTGLRVGLAVLTEAVLVAPLEGIGQVRVLNNLDGSRFVSIDFCGPIRAAGGTAQALAVLIADMIRRELNLAKYEPTEPEVERVKEEFGLYRGGLQYKPPPEEIEMIVKACPIMINGEETEDIECAGYREVRNIDGGRIRGGVMLVIGEGLCLKAAKIQKQTERLNVPGWDFISAFASKSKSDSDSDSVKRRKIKTDNRFMRDIIAGRPIFGEPNTPGGFRLRYGRPRTSGLAAAGVNPASMHAMGDFLAVGTQMKIERPGKACAVVPCDDLDGPTILLKSGRYGRVQSKEMWHRVQDEVLSIWDNGELMIGYGEFAENNKSLVPSGYVSDWFASDLLETLDSEVKVEQFAKILGVTRRRLPPGIPSTGTVDDPDDLIGNHRRQRTWHRRLQKMTLDWEVVVEISRSFLTAIPPPWNLWWNDLPLEFIPHLIDSLLASSIENATHPEDGIMTVPHPDRTWMRIPMAVENWQPIDHTPAELPSNQSVNSSGNIPQKSVPEQMPGPVKKIDQSVIGDWPNGTQHEEHGIIKSSLMILGIPHIHEGNDLLIMHGWQPLLEGLGLQLGAGDNASPEIRVDAKSHLESRIQLLLNAKKICSEEKSRLADIEERRSVLRIAAETAARQRGESIAETENEGRIAAEEIDDVGPKDAKSLESAELLLDEHTVDGALWLVRKCSELRWVAAAPCRIGCRMGRPEKAAPREMKGKPHSIFPIGNEGGPQRLITEAANKGTILVTMGTRECLKCGQRSPYTICHHRSIPDDPTECGGKTIPIDDGRPTNGRRKGINQSVNIPALLETKRIKLGLDRIPKKFKGVKGLTSIERYPEPLEKGILRAKYQLPSFKAGTVRFDMIDVPVTHFRPKDIGTSPERLVTLGYTHDIDGDPLVKLDQTLELYPQDFIPSRKASDYLLRACTYIDELLKRFYGMASFYNAEKPEDLVGHLCIGLAPHTSGGVLTRIIGWSNASAGYGHTLYHAAKRRNCDGDEDALILLLDCLLNFSRVLLPSNRGGRMDAPLTLSTRLNPEELDKEALNVDTSWWYHRGFYEATQHQPSPSEIANQMDIVDRRTGTVGAVRGYGYTHDAHSIDSGPENSSYKTLETMIDKMNAQLLLGQQLRGVDVRNVASQVVESHFLPDLRGNLVAFTRQKFRCVRCGESYRRFPLSGKCIKTPDQRNANRGMRSGIDFARGEAHLCGGNLALTVSEGAVRKYIRVMQHVIEHYGVDLYTRQRVEGLVNSADSLFKNDRVKVFTLDDFMS